MTDSERISELEAQVELLKRRVMLLELERLAPSPAPYIPPPAFPAWPSPYPWAPPTTYPPYVIG